MSKGESKLGNGYLRLLRTLSSAFSIAYQCYAVLFQSTTLKPCLHSAMNAKAACQYRENRAVLARSAVLAMARRVARVPGEA